MGRAHEGRHVRGEHIPHKSDGVSQKALTPASGTQVGQAGFPVMSHPLPHRVLRPNSHHPKLGLPLLRADGQRGSLSSSFPW